MKPLTREGGGILLSLDSTKKITHFKQIGKNILLILKDKLITQLFNFPNYSETYL